MISIKEVKYSLCILCLNRAEITLKCLKSIISITEFDDTAEIIIIDNGSTDDTVSQLRDFQKRYSIDKLEIVVVLNPGNRGCTGGRNQSIQLARGHYIIILDNDVEIIQPDWLKKLNQFYHSQKNIGIVGPKMLFAHNPNIIQQIGFGVTSTGNIGYLGRGKARYAKEYQGSKELQGYPAACWFMERKLFDQFGGFDEAFYPVNYEDADFCYRIREKGYKIVYCPEVEMYHHEHATTWNTETLPIMRITVKNGVLFKKRWRHMYSKEDGITQDDIFWKPVEGE